MPLFELLANTTNVRPAQTTADAAAQRSASAGELRAQRVKLYRNKAAA